MKDGVEQPWDEVRRLFRDRTGRPGPATWQLGTYADGQDDFPVGGISWYEAAARTVHGPENSSLPYITGTEPPRWQG